MEVRPHIVINADASRPAAAEPGPWMYRRSHVTRTELNQADLMPCTTEADRHTHTHLHTPLTGQRFTALNFAPCTAEHRCRCGAVKDHTQGARATEPPTAAAAACSDHIWRCHSTSHSAASKHQQPVGRALPPCPRGGTSRPPKTRNDRAVRPTRAFARIKLYTGTALSAAAAVTAVSAATAPTADEATDRRTSN